MRITVAMPDGTRKHGTVTSSTLVKQVAGRLMVPLTKWYFVFGGERLVPSAQLADYGIRDGSELTLASTGTSPTDWQPVGRARALQHWAGSVQVSLSSAAATPIVEPKRLFGATADLNVPAVVQAVDRTVNRPALVDRPVYVDRPVDVPVDRHMYVDRPVDRPVYIDRPVEKIVYVDRPVVFVDRPVDVRPPQHYVSPQQQSQQQNSIPQQLYHAPPTPQQHSSGEMAQPHQQVSPATAGSTALCVQELVLAPTQSETTQSAAPPRAPANGGGFWKGQSGVLAVRAVLSLSICSGHGLLSVMKAASRAEQLVLSSLRTTEACGTTAQLAHEQIHTQLLNALALIETTVQSAGPGSAAAEGGAMEGSPGSPGGREGGLARRAVELNSASAVRTAITLPHPLSTTSPSAHCITK